MKTITKAIVAGLFTVVSAATFACPKGTTLQGGTGPHHKGGSCVVASGATKAAKKEAAKANVAATKATNKANAAATKAEDKANLAAAKSKDAKAAATKAKADAKAVSTAAKTN